MKGDLRCIEGRLFRHDPQYDDPDLETDVGECPDCSGDGCGDDGEPVPKRGMSDAWLWREASSAKNTHLEIEARRRTGAESHVPMPSGRKDAPGSSKAAQPSSTCFTAAALDGTENMIDKAELEDLQNWLAVYATAPHLDEPMKARLARILRVLMSLSEAYEGEAAALIREWRSHWAHHNEAGLVAFADQVHATLLKQAAEIAKLEREKDLALANLGKLMHADYQREREALKERKRDPDEAFDGGRLG